MKPIRAIASVTTAVSATIIALLPIPVAIDFGGVLWWTQYAAGMAVLAAFVFALPALGDWKCYMRSRQLLITVPFLFWLLFSFFQTVPLPSWVVTFLSPGTHSAYTQWLQPILPTQMLPQSFPISVSRDDSRHAVAILGMIFVLAWISLRVFHTRVRLIGLLTSVSISGAVVAVLGVVGLMLPDLDFFAGMQQHFSTFVNRNNAALAMNLGLAGGLGLLSWRLSALTGQEVDGEGFEFNDLFALTSDRSSAIGFACVLLCMTGLLVSGSRAGLATVLFSTLLSLGWLRTKRGYKTIPVVLTAATILAAFFTVPMQLDLESIKRMEIFSKDAETVLSDGRFSHWPEGWTTATEHLPLGSGLATYGYAHLPHQNAVPKNWFAHADNLWLELFVEQGLIGIAFLVFFVLAIAYCLHRMSASHDALDHGLRVTGWYSLGAILFSQCFDFGLILPANFLIAVPLLAAVVSRSIDADQTPDDLPGKSSLRWKFWRRLGSLPLLDHAGHCVTLVAAALIICIAAVTLQIDAVADTIARRVNARLSSRSQFSSVEDLQTDLERMERKPHQALTLANLAKAKLQLGRLEEVASVQPASATELSAFYSATSPSVRRLVGRTPANFVNKFPAELSRLDNDRLPETYTLALMYYRDLVARVPLSREAREGLLYLDFVPSSRIGMRRPDDYSRSLLDQLSTLYASSPSQLIQIGNLAAQSRQNKIASMLWRTVIEQKPGFTVAVMVMVENYPEVKLMDVLPRNHLAMQYAARRIVNTKNREAAKHLPEIVEEFHCDRCRNTSDKANCLRLAGDALVFAQRHEESLSYYEKATKLLPSDAKIRLDLIGQLQLLGRDREALTQARVGRQIHRDDERFDEVIRQIAQGQLKDR